MSTIPSPGGSLHQNFVSEPQRALELSAESGAVASMDPVAIVQVNDQVERHSDTSLALSTSSVAASSDPVKESALSSTDKLALSPPGELTKQRSAADALAANRLPIALTWRDVNVTVDLPAPSFMEKRRSKKAAASKQTATVDTERVAVTDAPLPMKVILDGVSGYCRPGQLLAIMGSSGAGKVRRTAHHLPSSAHLLPSRILLTFLVDSLAACFPLLLCVLLDELAESAGWPLQQVRW